MRVGRDGIAGLAGLAVSLFLLPQAFGLPKLTIVPIGPGFYPAIVLVFAAFASGVLVLQDVAAQRRAGPAGADDGAQPKRAYGLVAAAFVIVAAYVVLLPALGFRIATVLFVAAFQMLLERPAAPLQWATLAAIAVGTSAVSHLVFEQYLTVLLPRGTWTGW
jgi:hypothetical protein